MRSNFIQFLGSVNDSTLNNVEVAFTVADCAVLLVTFFAGITANLFVAYAVYRQKSLQTSNNALLVNLAVTDFLRCATDCPLLLIIVLSGRRGGDLGNIVCNAEALLFSLSCLVQLFTLASISAERYQAIAYPFKTAQRRKRVMAWIPLTWAVPIIISVICVVFAKDSPVYVRCRALNLDTLTHDSFGRYVLFPVWFTCFAVIIGFYAQIFILVKAHSRKIFDKGVFPPPSTKVDENMKNVVKATEAKRTTETKPVMTPVIDNTNLTPEVNWSAGETKFPKLDPNVQKPFNIPAAAESRSLNMDTKSLDFRKTKDAPDQPKEQNVTFVSKLHNSAPILGELENNEDPSPVVAEITDCTTSVPKKDYSTLVPPDNANQNGEVMGAVCMIQSFVNKERGNKKKEGKLAKRSGYIILTFVIFWIPLIGTVIFNIFLNRDRNPSVEIFEEFEILAVSIACMTSLTNPIIYAAVNPQFRSELFYLKLRCKAFCTKP
ncbi:parietopsin [Electrophorus electricus]|uniref:parietopsin n=1 Tax=Electrophorus electricus TaxID=8005 RepID=UPI0015CFCC46|nr:parietopsin [Electrophorus electricus]